MISSPWSQWRSLNIASVVGGQKVLVSWLISPMAIRGMISLPGYCQARCDRFLSADGVIPALGPERRVRGMPIEARHLDLSNSFRRADGPIRGRHRPPRRGALQALPWGRP